MKELLATLYAKEGEKDSNIIKEWKLEAGK
jgi:hypothetical protein